MTTFSFIVGIGVAVAAPQLMLPGFVVLEAYRLTAPVKPSVVFATANCKSDPTSWQCEISSGAEYAVGYYIGTAVMSYLFGAQ